MPFAHAILWAQWRTLRNYYPRNGIALTAIVGILWYGLWTAASLGLIQVFRESSNAVMIHNVLPSGLLIVFLYWQLIPILLATPGASLELQKVRIYPVPVIQLFLVEVLLRFTSGVEVVLLMMGATIGILMNPALPHWGFIGALLYVLFNLLLAVGLRDLLARVLARRRIREAAFLLIVLTAALPQLLITRRGPGVLRIFQLLGAKPWWGWPWTAGASLMQGSGMQGSAALLDLFVISFWVVVAAAFSRWQFTKTLEFDASAAGAIRDADTPRRGFLEAFYRLPSRLFKDPLGALIEKEVRFLLRSPRFRIVFLMGFTFGLLIWLPMAVGYGGYRTGPISDRGITPFFYRNYLTVVSIYSMLLLSEICFWNSFGFDRSAAQFYFLAPIPFSRVLVAKNLTAMFFILTEIAIVTSVCAMLGMPLGISRLLEAFLVVIVASSYLLSAGNIHSIREARAVNPATSFRSGAAGRIQAMMFVIYPITFAPVILAYLARYAFGTQTAFYSVLLCAAVLGFVLYRIALQSASETAAASREKMIAALSTSEGPIAE